MEVYEKIKLTRKAGRPTAKDFIAGLFDGFTELHGDRRFGDDHAVMAGLAELNGMPVTVIGIEKGRDIAERIDRNFGCVSPEGYRKALRQMKLAEKFRRPVITVVDTQGAYCGGGAEERGEGQAIAENLVEMMALKVPVLTLMIGEGGSGGALALAVADEVWMLENAYYSVVSPEACASILYKDSAKADIAAEHLRLTAEDLYGFGIIEKIIREPENYGEVEKDSAFFRSLRNELARRIRKLSGEETAELLAFRYEKYRKIGRYSEAEAQAPLSKRSFWHRRTK